MMCKSSILLKMHVKAKNDSQFPGDIILMYSLEDQGIFEKYSHS